MVEQRICSFCGTNIEPGTGRLYVRRDGLTFNFCSSKCFKNQIELKRVPRMTEWTAAYKREKETMKGATHMERESATRKVARKVRRVKEQRKRKEEAPKEEKAPNEEKEKQKETPPVEEKEEGSKQ